MPDKETLLEMYRRMVRIRTFEEEANYLFLQGKIPGTLHQYDGQEAVAVGTCMHLNDRDFITSTHRPHGHSIAKGVDTSKIMAELFGRETGCCRGKGGSMHICDMSMGVIPAIAIVGGGIPVAAGLALAFKMREMENVVACFFGEGASSQGAFHEGVNLSALWKLPVVFICENNLYAASTHVSKALPVDGVAPRASSYGIPGVVVDGNDVLAVFDAVGKAVEDARTGKGPTLVECRTYRRRGHSRSDPGNYRPKEEVEEWLEKDPITRLGRHLVEEGTATQAELDEIGNSITGEIEEAIRFSEESPFPDPSIAYEDVFTEM